EIVAEGEEGDGAGNHHGSDERPRRRFGGEIRGCDASGRAKHAKFYAAEGAGKMRTAGAAEARAEQHGERAADVRGIYHGAREFRSIALRAGDSNVRNGDAQHL